VILEVVRYRIEILKEGGKVMNNYDVAEIIELGKANELILEQKLAAVRTDNLSQPFSTDAESIDDFDE